MVSDHDGARTSLSTATIALSALGQNVGVWQWDIRNNSLEWGDRMLEIHGLTADTFRPSADSFFELIHPDDLAMVNERVQDHLEYGAPYRVVFRIRHADGHYIHCRTEGARIPSDRGTISKMIGVTFDITSEMEAVTNLRESEHRLATLASNFDGAIFRYRLNTDGTDSIDYMSDGAERVWGLQPAEILGDPGKVWATVHWDDLDSVRKVFTAHTSDQTRICHQWRVVLPDGYCRWIECRATPTKLPSGDTLWDGFVIDISALVAAQDALTEKTQMLGQAQKLEAIGRISGGIAHDFNNLLAIILGNAELIDTTSLSAEDIESQKTIIAACQKGASLTRRLLSFAQKSRLEPKLVQLKDVVDGMIPLARRTLPTDINIHWDKAQYPPLTVAVDVGMLESSILNIMLNARDAMPSGGDLSIRIVEQDIPTQKLKRANGSLPAGRYALLEISDTGHGIPGELLGRVTEPFITSKGPEMGSGLGLAMVDGFVTQSGGFLQIESTEGAGTTLTVFIPVTEREAREAPQPISNEPDQLMFDGRVLLVEDEADVRLVLARMLRRLGLQVDEAENGENAKAILDTDAPKYDLIITDIMMPGLVNGIDLARSVRANQPDLPVILISGYNDETFNQRGDQTDLGLFLMKPVKGRELRDAIVRSYLKD